MKKAKFSNMKFDAEGEESYPNRAVYAVAKKSEGKLRLYRRLMILGYILFSVAFFVVCYVIRIIPLVAVLPLIVYIIHGFTWRYVSYDVVWQFEGGAMIFGKVYGRNTHRIYKPKLEVRISDCVMAGPADSAACADAYADCKVKWDFSSSSDSPDACVLIRKEEDGTYTGIRFDAIAKVARLLKTFCPGADFSGKEFRF